MNGTDCGWAGEAPRDHTPARLAVVHRGTQPPSHWLVAAVTDTVGPTVYSTYTAHTAAAPASQPASMVVPPPQSPDGRRRSPPPPASLPTVVEVASLSHPSKERQGLIVPPLGRLGPHPRTVRDPARAATDSLALAPTRTLAQSAVCCRAEAPHRWSATLPSRCAWPARCSRPAACASTADDASSPRVLPPPLAGGHHGFESRTGAGGGRGWGGAARASRGRGRDISPRTLPRAGSWSLHPVTSPPLRAALLRQCSSHGSARGAQPRGTRRG